MGLTVVKIFPAAQLGGPSYLRSLAGPFPDVCFVATGGITAQDARHYLALDNVLAVGGSWLNQVPTGWVAARAQAAPSDGEQTS
jgi:2-dehydro-3-deoxyphosphogluconate aldolase/(4S)-4-hydroxy-2-oxoglutarate aldolase